MSEVFLSLVEAAEQVRSKKISPRELVEGTLQRIERLNPRLNAYITVQEQEAREEASRLEKELMQGKVRGPLHGIPIAVKDNLQTRGTRTTSGSKIFAEWIPDEDATAVRKLKEAGAIIIGKANLHEFAMGATSENPHYGVIRNPWNLEKIPGGSSGGSAVAVAACLAYGALGTDTAGSIRLPAAMCGITGIKATYGLVSRHGCFPFSWSLDHVGPMARTVKDTAVLLEVIAGYDERDPSSCTGRYDLAGFRSREDLQGVRLGLMKKYLFEGMDPAVGQVIDRAIERLRELGAEIVSLELSGLDEALQSLRVIAQAEVFSIHEPLLEKFADLYGDDVKFRFRFGRQQTAAAYLNAQRIRRRFIAHAKEVLANVDALLGPTNVRQPYTIGTVPPEEAINNMFTLGKTPLANILGFPSLTIPCGFTEDGLPVGLQLIGKPFSEKRLVEIADCYERTEKWVANLIEMNRNMGERT